MRKSSLLSISVLFLVLCSIAASAFQLESVSVTKKGVLGYVPSSLAIALDKGYYKPGELVTVQAISEIPCTTTKVQFVVQQKSGGSQTYTQDITNSVPSSCMTGIFKVTFFAPQETGDYLVGVRYLDCNSKEIYTDSVTLVVSQAQPTCPAPYCTAWQDSARIANGDVQTKTCFTVGADCGLTPTGSNRIVCDSGYTLTQDNTCYNPSAPAPTTQPAPVCGNGKVEGAELCDNAAQNGACPALCAANCLPNLCHAPAPVDEQTGGISSLWLIGGSLVALGGGYWLWKGRRRRR